MICCIANVVYAQTDTASLKIIEHALRRYDSGLIFYADRIDDFGFNRIQESFANNNFFSWHNGKSKSVSLSSTELQYLNAELKKYRKPYWKDSLFQKAKCISMDSFHNYDGGRLYKRKLFEIFENPYTTAHLKLDLLPELKKYHWAFSFTEPIYFRNGTLYAMYLMHICGNTCGGYEFAVFKNDEANWKYWFSITSGDF